MQANLFDPVPRFSMRTPSTKHVQTLSLCRPLRQKIANKYFHWFVCLATWLPFTSVSLASRKLPPPVRQKRFIKDSKDGGFVSASSFLYPHFLYLVEKQSARLRNYTRAVSCGIANLPTSCSRRFADTLADCANAVSVVV